MAAWHDRFEFHYVPEAQERKRRIVDAANGSDARCILIENSVALWDRGDESMFERHAFRLNDRCSLTWLVDTAEEVRRGTESTVVVSNVPARIDPPTVSWIEMPAGRQRTFSSPPGTSLALLRPTDDAPMAIFFGAIHEISYYDIVLRSQGCPPREPVQISVFCGEGDGGLLVDEHRALRTSDDPTVHRRTLVAASEQLERTVDRPGRTAGILHR